MNSDNMTTILGTAMGGVTAAPAIISVVQSGSLHSGDWISLISAVLITIFGFFTNKTAK